MLFRKLLPKTSLLVLSLFFAACAATRGQETKHFSGFLKDYDKLKPLGDDRVLTWVKPNLSLAKYKRIMIDKPEIWLTEEARKSMDEDTLANLTTYWNNSIRTKLGQLWEITEEAGPDVVQLRTAITQLTGAFAPMTPFTRVLPQGVILSQGVRLVTGSYPFVGKVTGEGELLDSVSGERLFAGVDRRVGNNIITNTASTWGDVKDAFDYWSTRVARRLINRGMKPTKGDPALWQKATEK